jgi:hypothetical protein
VSGLYSDQDSDRQWHTVTDRGTQTEGEGREEKKRKVWSGQLAGGREGGGWSQLSTNYK